MVEKELKSQKTGFVSSVFYHEQNAIVLGATQNTGLELGFEILLCNARGSACLFFHQGFADRAVEIISLLFSLFTIVHYFPLSLDCTLNNTCP